MALDRHARENVEFYVKLFLTLVPCVLLLFVCVVLWFVYGALWRFAFFLFAWWPVVWSLSNKFYVSCLFVVSREGFCQLLDALWRFAFFLFAWWPVVWSLSNKFYVSCLFVVSLEGFCQLLDERKAGRSCASDETHATVLLAKAAQRLQRLAKLVVDKLDEARKGKKCAAERRCLALAPPRGPVTHHGIRNCPEAGLGHRSQGFRLGEHGMAMVLKFIAVPILSVFLLVLMTAHHLIFGGFFQTAMVVAVLLQSFCLSWSWCDPSADESNYNRLVYNGCLFFLRMLEEQTRKDAFQIFALLLGAILIAHAFIYLLKIWAIDIWALIVFTYLRLFPDTKNESVWLYNLHHGFKNREQLNMRIVAHLERHPASGMGWRYLFAYHMDGITQLQLSPNKDLTDAAGRVIDEAASVAVARPRNVHEWCYPEQLKAIITSHLECHPESENGWKYLSKLHLGGIRRLQASDNARVAEHAAHVVEDLGRENIRGRPELRDLILYHVKKHPSSTIAWKYIAANLYDDFLLMLLSSNEALAEAAFSAIEMVDLTRHPNFHDEVITNLLENMKPDDRRSKNALRYLRRFGQAENLKAGLNKHLVTFAKLLSSEDPWLAIESRKVLEFLMCSKYLLHKAAENNHTNLCEVLLQTISVRLLDDEWNTAKIVARNKGHKDLSQFLENAENALSVRCGSGDAYDDAVKDLRRVVEVQWYTMPLAGAAGMIGGCHSVLSIKVAGEGEEHTYTIERSQVDDKRAKTNQFRNGVHISHWKDVQKLVSRKFCETLVVEERNEPTTMQDLWKRAIEAGNYTVGANNCHHTARMIYNMLAKEGERKKNMPNSKLSVLARGLDMIGVFGGGSGSVSQSTSISVSRSGRFESSLGPVSRTERISNVPAWEAMKPEKKLLDELLGNKGIAKSCPRICEIVDQVQTKMEESHMQAVITELCQALIEFTEDWAEQLQRAALRLSPDGSKEIRCYDRDRLELRLCVHQEDSRGRRFELHVDDIPPQSKFPLKLEVDLAGNYQHIFAMVAYTHDLQDQEVKAGNLYFELNAYLRSTLTPQKQKSWLLSIGRHARDTTWDIFMHYAIVGLALLPQYKGLVYRGMTNFQDWERWPLDHVVDWYSFFSSSEKLDVARGFADEDNGTGIVFKIEVNNGYKLERISAIPSEAEILLRPGTALQVVSRVYNQDGYRMLDLKEL